MNLIDKDTGEIEESKRMAWTPDPIPARTVRKEYYQTVTGTGRLDLVPE